MNPTIVAEIRAKLSKTMREYYDNTSIEPFYADSHAVIYKIYVDLGIVFVDFWPGQKNIHYLNEEFLTEERIAYLLKLYLDGHITHFMISTGKKRVIISTTKFSFRS